MNENTVTRESCHEVMAWLKSGDTTPNPVMEDKFLDVLATLVHQRMTHGDIRRREYAPKGHPLSLRHIVDEMREAGEIDCTYEELMGITPKAEVQTVSETPEESPAAAGYDSYELAKVLKYMGTSESHPLNMSQLQIILYISYGIWLASTGERLTSEHPQLWQFGPVFPRAYNKIRKTSESGREAYDMLKSSNPQLLGFLDDQFHRFGWASAMTVTAPHTAAGSPWAKARKKSPDRWGVPLDDGDIASWFSSRIQER